MQTSGDQRREIMDLRPMPDPVIASAATCPPKSWRRRKQSISPHKERMDCFASLAMTWIDCSSVARVSAAIPGVVSADGLPACRSAHAGYDLKDEHPGRRPPALRKPWAKENNRASQCVYLKCK